MQDKGMAKTGQEVVFEGWLTKSPPTKRIWRARWRRRWFSLTNSGELPGQFVLTYYTDRKCRHAKGVINLDQCEQVDVSFKLDQRDLKFDHVFAIKTPTRTYYLAADTELEMRSWVKNILNVCGIKCTSEDEEYEMNQSPDIEIVEEECSRECNRDVPVARHFSLPSADTPPISPVSTSPYIPISECITGRSIYNKQNFKSLLDYNIKNSSGKSDTWHNDTYDTSSSSQKLYLNYVNDMQDPRFYDLPRSLGTSSIKNNTSKEDSPLQSPTDSENVFHDDEWTHNSSVDNSKMKRPSNSSADIDIVTQKFTKTEAPPRPPKPITAVGTSPNYLNLTLPTSAPLKISDTNSSSHRNNGDTQKIVSDETYDFPRSHQVESDCLKNNRRHCYNNAAPVMVDGHIFRYDISPKPGTSQVFHYEMGESQEEPASPHSQGSSTPAYSNLPSPLLGDAQMMPPPTVNRELKPRRKLSDSLSTSSNQEPPSPRGGPSVDRKLKPPTPLQEAHMRRNFNNDDDVKKIRAAPSPTPPSLRYSAENLYSNDSDYVTGKMQYLDLDLDCNFPSNSNNLSQGSSVRSPGPNTVYKKVDFTKTQAFNITRNNLEKERQEPLNFHTHKK